MVDDDPLTRSGGNESIEFALSIQIVVVMINEANPRAKLILPCLPRYLVTVPGCYMGTLRGVLVPGYCIRLWSSGVIAVRVLLRNMQ